VTLSRGTLQGHFTQSIAATDDLISLCRSKVKVTAGRQGHILSGEQHIL